jgi:hypothetical protein
LDIAYLKSQAYMSLHEKLLSEHPDVSIEVTFDHPEILKRQKMIFRKSKQ